MAVSLYCGAGGACLGLRQAGFDVVAGLDLDEDALATYAAAGGHPVEHEITEEVPVPPELVGALTGLDLLWASPPCQPWSRAGKRLGADDARDGWPATIAAVRLLRPRWFIAENVRGVEEHLDAAVIPALRRMGYVVERRTLDAADYGVPQRRHRVFVVAGPSGLPWPRQTHGKRAGLFVKPWQSMGEALGIVSPENAHPSATIRAGGSIDHTGKMGGGASMYVHDPKHPLGRLDDPAPTIRSGGDGHSALPLHVVAAGETGEGRPRSMDHPAPTMGTKGTAYLLDQPSPAVLATESKGARHQVYDPDRTCARASDALWRATGRRRLTTAECAILQDFPPDYPWRGGITSLYRQIGNAVPPTLARVLAGAVIAVEGDDDPR